MTSFMQSISDNYKDWKTGYSPEVDKWILMDNPGNAVLILLAYLAFVLKIGPAIMKNRPAMELRRTMIAYNGIQVIFSIMLVWMSTRVEIPLNSLFSSSCKQKVHSPKNKMLFIEGAWWYHFAKVTELLDTVFFVLRKRNRQITFLHVYHHSVTMFYSWLFLKYSPGEQGSIIGLLNSSVHVLMYSYYLIAAMGPAYQKYIWWKKYMTVIQLVQFCVIIAYLSLLSLSNCGHSTSVTYFFIINAFIFLYMFLDFYRKSYSKTSKALTNGSLQKASGGERPTSNVSEVKGFVDDDEAYSRISKDVDLLNKAEKIIKRE